MCGSSWQCAILKSKVVQTVDTNDNSEQSAGVAATTTQTLGACNAVWRLCSISFLLVALLYLWPHAGAIVFTARKA